jgi:malate dehydrogenase (oxaloacetate-decarboxylating)(NADP+)
MLVGVEKPVQIARLGASVSEITTLAALAAYDPEKHEVDSPLAE